MAGRLRYRRRGLVALSAAAAGLVGVGWLATTPLLADHWPRALAVGLFLFVFVLPRWFVPARSAASLAGVADPTARGRLEDDRLKLQNDVRVGLLQALAGVAVIAAVVLTWQQLEADRRQLRQQLAAAGQEQTADRFARAVDQLGSDRVDVRLGGVYGLGRVAALAATQAATQAAAAQDRVQVFEILSAYVRAHSRRPPADAAERSTLPGRLADIQAAMNVLGRRTVLPGDTPLDLSGSLLPGSRLTLARLAGADLRGVDLRAADLQQADLSGARLDGALLCGAQLQGADLRGAVLAGAWVSGKTQWPTGFDWKGAGARLVGSCS